MKELLTARDVADSLRVSQRHALRLMADMRPINISTGGKRAVLRVYAAELDAWAQRKRSDATGAAIQTQRKPRLKVYRNTALVNGRIPYEKAK